MIAAALIKTDGGASTGAGVDSSKVTFENSIQSRQAWSQFIRVQNAMLLLNVLSIFIGMTFFDISRDEYVSDFKAIRIPLLNCTSYDCLLGFSSFVAGALILLAFYKRYLSLRLEIYKGKNFKIGITDIFTGSKELYITLIFSLFHPNFYFDSFQENGKPMVLDFFDDRTSYTLNDIFCLLNLFKILLVFISIIRLIPYNSDVAERLWLIY